MIKKKKRIINLEEIIFKGVDYKSGEGAATATASP